MAFWDGLLGPDVGLYDELLTEKQRNAINDPFSSRSLAMMSKAFADAAKPSLTPGPGLGSAIGNAAYMMSAGRDEAAQTLLKAGLTAQQIKDLQVTAQGRSLVTQIIQRAMAAQGVPGAGGTTPVTPTPAVPRPAATSPLVSNPPAPPGLVPPSIGPGMGTGYTGLLGGDTQTAGLSPLDEYIPDPSRQGLFDILQASYGGGVGTPGSPFRDGAATTDNAAALLRLASASPRDRESMLDTIAQYESGGRNVMQGIVPPGGGYNPSVGRVTGPSTAQGPWQITNETWRDAAPKAGIDTDKYPTAMSAPVDVQRTVAGQLLDERGLEPWAPYNARLAQATGYQGRVRIQSLGGESSQLGVLPDVRGGTLSQTIPGFNMTPAQLSLLDAMAEVNKMGTPFKGILDAYYKTPEYLSQAAGATAAGQQKYVQENAANEARLRAAADLLGKGIVQRPDGTYQAITSIQEALAAVDNLKLTGDIKEYNFYKQQEMARGQIPKSFEVWQLENKRAAATMINTAEGFDAAQTKARIAVDQDAAKNAGEVALSSRRLLPLVDQMIEIANKTPGGWAGPASATIAKAFAAVGLPVSEGMSNAELMVSLTQRLIPTVREPGATAAVEMNAYLAALGGLSSTPEGRLKIAQMTRRMSERAIEIAEVYRNNIGAPDLYDKLKALDKPIFTPDQRAEIDKHVNAPGATAPPGGGGPAARPTSQAEYNALPPGTQFIAPDGTTRIKP